MPTNPVRDIRRSGVLSSKSSTTAGPADEFSSSVTILPHGVVVQEDNNGTPIAKRHGDGRSWMPIQTSQPGTLTPGQFWFETIATVDYFRFVDHNGVIQSIASGTVVPPSVTSVTLTTPSTPYTVDSVNTNAVGVILWHLAIVDLVTGRRAVYLVHCVNNATTVAAATDTALSIIGGASIGTPPIGNEVSFGTVLSGIYGSQTMSLTVTPSTTGLVAEILRSYMVAA